MLNYVYQLERTVIKVKCFQIVCSSYSSSINIGLSLWKRYNALNILSNLIFPGAKESAKEATRELECGNGPGESILILFELSEHQMFTVGWHNITYVPFSMM